MMTPFRVVFSAMLMCVLASAPLALATGPSGNYQARLSQPAGKVIGMISGISKLEPSQQQSHLPFLIDALYHRNPLVAEAAGGEIGQLAVDVSSAIPHLMGKMRSARGRDGNIFALFIAKIGDPAIPALRDALTTPDPVLRKRTCSAFKLMERYEAQSRFCDF